MANHATNFMGVINYTNNEPDEQYGRGSILMELGNTSSIVVEDIIVEKDEIITKHVHSMNFTHQNSLRSYAIIQTNNNVLYEVYDCKWKEFLKILEGNKSKSIKPVMTTTLTGSPNSYRFVPEEIKKMIRSMVIFIQDQHKSFRCTTGFTANNIVMKGEELKFWHISYIKSDQIAKQNDYKHLKEVLESCLFSSEYQPLPHDMICFLHLLDNSAGNEFLIRHHIAILDSNERLKFINHLHNKHAYMSSKQLLIFLSCVNAVYQPSGNRSLSHGQTLSASGNPSSSHGQTLSASGNPSSSRGQILSSSGNPSSSRGQILSASGNSYRQALLSSGNPSSSRGQILSSSGNPSSSCGQTLSTSGKPSWSNCIIPNSPLDRILNYKLNKPYEDNGMEIFRFLRNCVEHLGHHCNHSANYEYKDVEKMIMSYFSDKVTQLQQQLHKKKLLNLYF